MRRSYVARLRLRGDHTVRTPTTSDGFRGSLAEGTDHNPNSTLTAMRRCNRDEQLT
jgi:hypothetical protein